MNDHASSEVQAVATVGGALTDLIELAERLPVPPDQAEATARILDRVAEEHEPLVMTPGDVRGLLARFQRAAAWLLDVIDGDRR